MSGLFHSDKLVPRNEFGERQEMSKTHLGNARAELKS